MPLKSKAQRRKFAELLLKGEITEEAFERWNRETGSAELPERVGDRRGATKRKKRPAKAKRTARSKTKRTTRVKTKRTTRVKTKRTTRVKTKRATARRR
jgi:hypothetical protein